MPYIITTMPAGSAAHPERMSRRAVATPEEVADYLTDEVGYSATTGDVREIMHAGGIISPLSPAGDAIAIEQVGWVELQQRGEYTRRTGPYPGPRDNTGIIDAFNKGERCPTPN